MAMSDNKPKIDLKSRLGKKSVSTKGGPSIPPPVGIPRPAVPGQVGIKVDASNPYAAISSDAVPVKKEPQAIKVEMSQEVLEAQKKGKTLITVLAAGMALIGGLLGYALGGRIESNKGAQKAVADAGELVKEVNKANGTALEMAEVLGAIAEKLKSNKYPGDEAKKLGSLNVDFSGLNLAGKAIGRFQLNMVKDLITYAGSAQEANDQKDKLQNLISVAKSEIAGYLDQQDETKRKIQWALFVQSGTKGPVAVMQPLEKEQWFQVDKKDDKAYKWPDKFKIKEGNKTFDLERYAKGDPISSSPKIIPVDPTSHGAVCPVTVMGRLSAEASKLEELLKGDKTPGAEKTGMVDLGDKLVQDLKKIGKP
jgi:hypothetical protein